MAVDSVPAQCLRILFYKKDGFAIGSPRKSRCHTFECVVEFLAAFNVDEVNVVEASADSVDGIAKGLVVRADFESPHRVESMTFGSDIHIEQHFFVGVHGALAPAIDRVLLAFFISSVIEVVSVRNGRGLIDLCHSRLHLLDESLLKISVLPENTVRIRVFLFEILNDLGVFTFTKPVVLVDANVSVYFEFGGLFRSGRCFLFVGTAGHNQGKKDNHHRNFCQVHWKFLADKLSFGNQ